MDKPTIVKIESRRNIGFNKVKGYFVDEHTGIDKDGNKWNWLALVNPINGKVMETYDYRKVK